MSQTNLWTNLLFNTPLKTITSLSCFAIEAIWYRAKRKKEPEYRFFPWGNKDPTFKWAWIFFTKLPLILIITGFISSILTGFIAGFFHLEHLNMP